MSLVGFFGFSGPALRLFFILTGRASRLDACLAIGRRWCFTRRVHTAVAHAVCGRHP